VDLRTIVTLARAVQARDPYAAGRSERVTRLAQRIAGELGFGVELNHAIAVGVVCADIGKIGLPDRLLQGRGQLSDEDYATLRSYPAMSSAKSPKRSGSLGTVVSITVADSPYSGTSPPLRAT